MLTVLTFIYFNSKNVYYAEHKMYNTYHKIPSKTCFKTLMSQKKALNYVIQNRIDYNVCVYLIAVNLRLIQRFVLFSALL